LRGPNSIVKNVLESAAVSFAGALQQVQRGASLRFRFSIATLPESRGDLQCWHLDTTRDVFGNCLAKFIKDHLWKRER
jgi:hypothetical protein